MSESTKPVIVPNDASADECNLKYGERYGVDWVYEGKRAVSRICCFLNCGQPSEFEIWDEGEQDPHMGGTDACEAHVGALIGSVPPTEPNGPWTVRCIAPCPTPA